MGNKGKKNYEVYLSRWLKLLDSRVAIFARPDGLKSPDANILNTHFGWILWANLCANKAIGENAKEMLGAKNSYLAAALKFMSRTRKNSFL